MISLTLTCPLIGLALMFAMQRIEDHIVPTDPR